MDDKCANGGGVVRLYLDDHGFALPLVDLPRGAPPLATQPYCGISDESIIGGLVRARPFSVAPCQT